jgi:hypothetical protein
MVERAEITDAVSVAAILKAALLFKDRAKGEQSETGN